jgi:tetratricopeptide (TPR) repeat protein
MRRTAVAAVVGFALAFPSLPFRPAVADDAAIARAIAGSETEAKADWEKRLPELVEAVERDPQSPYAVAALRQILAVLDDSRTPEVVEQRLDPVLSRGVADGEIDELMREVLARRAWARGDADRARSYDADRGYVRRFAAVGPIGWSDAALVHRRYGPEAPSFDPKQTWEGSRRRVGWTALEPNPDSGWIDPWARLRDAGQGIWYATARVRSAGARNVMVKVYCRDSFKVLVNGRDVAVADRERDFAPWTVIRPATFVDGWNRIVVKVTGRSAFALKLCDERTGLPLDGLEEGDPLEPGACPDPGPVPSELAYRAPAFRVVKECLDGPADAARAAVAASVAGDDWRLWDAWKLHEKAVASLGGADPVLTANVRAARGQFLSGFWPLPNVQKKLRAKEELAAAVAAYPAHVRANVRLAEYENEDDHPDKAVKALRELLKKAESADGWMALARIARGREWEPEAVDAARRALAIAPRSGDAMQFLDQSDRELGNHAALEKRARARLEADRSDRGAAQALVSHLRAQGRHAEALQTLRDLAARWPLEHGWERQAAEVLSAMGRDDEALAAWRALEPKLPADEAVARRAGEILEVKGDRAGAADAYRRSLAIEPFQPNLWRALARIEGKEEDFAAGWEPDVAQALASLPSAEELKKKYPKAVAVTVLDHTVTRVNPDGSSRSYVHMVYKVLDEKGVDKYGDLPNAGETLLVRAILPDGTVTTPTGMQGRPFNIEGLVPGTVLEHRWAANERGTAKGYSGDKFYFQDFEVQQNPNPVLLSRFVVLTPEGMKLDPRKRNYEGDPKVESKDGWTATVWEKRDMPIVEPERNMPERDEIFPHVDYSIARTFEDAPWELLGTRMDSRGSPMIDDAVAKCVKPGASDAENLRAIHEFVNAEITGDMSGGSGPTAVLLEKSGSRELLFEAMVRAAGIPYRIGRALPWNGSGRDLSEQDPNAFSGRFLWIEPRGAAPVPFFTLGHHAPFGLVPEPYRGSAAFVLDEAGGFITRLPQGGADVDDTATFAIRLGADATATTIEGTVSYRSPNGYAYKRSLIDMSGDDRRKFAEGQFASWFANPKLEAYELPKLEERGQPLEVRLRGTMSTYLAQQGDTWVASLGLPETSAGQRFVDKAERTFDLVLRGRDDRVDEYTIDLGDAWEVKSLPQDHVAVHDVGVYSLTWRHEGSVIRVRRERHFHPARYRPDEYKPFVSWCKAIDDAEDRKLELRKVK